MSYILRQQPPVVQKLIWIAALHDLSCWAVCLGKWGCGSPRMALERVLTGFLFLVSPKFGFLPGTVLLWACGIWPLMGWWLLDGPRVAWQAII